MLPPSRRARTSSQNSSLSPHCAGGLEKQGRKPRLVEPVDRPPFARGFMRPVTRHRKRACQAEVCEDMGDRRVAQLPISIRGCRREAGRRGLPRAGGERAHHAEQRSEEHTSDLPSLMRISYAVFCSEKK